VDKRTALNEHPLGPRQASAPVLNGLLFATYRFLLKVQEEDARREPTLAQIFVAGAGCGLAST